MKKIFCDRCEKVILIERDAVKINAIYQSSLDGREMRVMFDLCEKCKKSFENFLKGEGYERNIKSK